MRCGWEHWPDHEERCAVLECFLIPHRWAGECVGRLTKVFFSEGREVFTVNPKDGMRAEARLRDAVLERTLWFPSFLDRDISQSASDRPTSSPPRATRRPTSISTGSICSGACALESLSVFHIPIHEYRLANAPLSGESGGVVSAAQRQRD